MEKKIKIQSVKWYAEVTQEQMSDILQELKQRDAAEMVLLPDSNSPGKYVAILKNKYYTEELSEHAGIQETRLQEGLRWMWLSESCSRVYLSSVLRKIRPTRPRVSEIMDDTAPTENSNLDDLLDMARESKSQEEFHFKPLRYEKENPVLTFLRENTPLCIEKKLNQHVIGQGELTKAVADFLYYHALRQLHPELPQRPLLISGPSGSGKTEVWRVAARLYAHLFPIRIIDGSNMSCEGWSGNYKIDTYVDQQMAQGGILVVDEFDKLTRPKVSSGGSNVSMDMQAEFLKLIEGEYQITEKRKPTPYTSKKMGFVMVGAFESLRQEKEEPQEKKVASIGFCSEIPESTQKMPKSNTLTDEDFIAYGIMPEIVGRIAQRCTTNPLSDRAYMDIIRGPHSRVALLESVLLSYGAQVSDVICDEELQTLVATSKSNRTGVRWVSAQVENRLLSAIHEKGLFQVQEQEPQRRCG